MNDRELVQPSASPSRRFPKTLWAILAVAASVRLLLAWIANLDYDESMIIAFAERFDLRPGNNLPLAWQTIDHPLLTVYVVKTSGFLFGNSDFGLRILHVVFGTGTVFLVFLLGRKVSSVHTGLYAAALLAVDRFHHTWSSFFIPEILLLFFTALALLLYLRAMETQSRKDFALLGAALGLAYLSKETAILLFPIIWLQCCPGKVAPLDGKSRPLNVLWPVLPGNDLKSRGRKWSPERSIRTRQSFRNEIDVAIKITFKKMASVPQEVRGDQGKSNRMHHEPFVVRTKKNILLQRRYSHPVDKSTGLRSDQTVTWRTSGVLRKWIPTGPFS